MTHGPSHNPITPAWFPLRYHPEQARLWRTRARYVAVAAGRGSGKTELARRRIVRYLPVKRRWPAEYFYAMPTNDHARRVAWEPLLRLIPQDWIEEKHESRMTIRTVFGSTLRVFGLDKPMRAEGLQYDGGVLDESSDQRPGVFDRTFRPALSHRAGWCLRIGVPKRFGVGAREFREACFSWRDKNDGVHESYSWPSDGILDPAEILMNQQSMDPKDFAEQYGASWETASGMVYYCFDPEDSVIDVSPYDRTQPLLIGSDFNVDPMAWVVGQACDSKTGKAGTKIDSIVIFDEVWERNTNTRKCLDILWSRYQNHEGGFMFFGDATSRARKTSASATDYAQIRNDERFDPSNVQYPKSNPAVRDRVAAVNAMLQSAAGARRLKIHRRCTQLIRDLGYLSYREGSTEIDDRDPDAGHITDALGYLVNRLCPMRAAADQLVPRVGASSNV